MRATSARSIGDGLRLDHGLRVSHALLRQEGGGGGISWGRSRGRGPRTVRERDSFGAE